MIGLDRVTGVFGTDAFDAWTSTGQPLAVIAQATATEVATMLEDGSATVIDVRGRTEWEAGHLPGVENIPLGYLDERLHELPTHLPVVVHCQGGARSAIAASLLQAHGVPHVVNMAGGFLAWNVAQLAVHR